MKTTRISADKTYFFVGGGSIAGLKAGDCILLCPLSDDRKPEYAICFVRQEKMLKVTDRDGLSTLNDNPDLLYDGIVIPQMVPQKFLGLVAMIAMTHGCLAVESKTENPKYHAYRLQSPSV